MSLLKNRMVSSAVFNNSSNSSHSSWGFLGCDGMWCCGSIQRFWMTLLPPSLGWSAGCLEMDLDIGAGSGMGRDICKPMGSRWDMPMKGPLAGRGKRWNIFVWEGSGGRTWKGPVCRTVKLRGSTSLFLREGLLLFLQGLNEILSWLAQGETFSVHTVSV
jgi:hypothetical protein